METLERAFRVLAEGYELAAPPLGLERVLVELAALCQELDALREDNALCATQVPPIPAEDVEVLRQRNRYLEGEAKRWDALEQPLGKK